MKKHKICPKCHITAEEGSYVFETGYCMYCGIPLEDVEEKTRTAGTKA